MENIEPWGLYHISNHWRWANRVFFMIWWIYLNEKCEKVKNIFILKFKKKVYLFAFSRRMNFKWVELDSDRKNGFAWWLQFHNISQIHKWKSCSSRWPDILLLAYVWVKLVWYSDMTLLQRITNMKTKTVTYMLK